MTVLQERRVLERLKAKAKESDHKHYRHAAAIVHPQRGILALACNNSKFFSGRERERFHAEARVLRKVQDQDLSGCELWVVRVNDRGALRNSEPCQACKERIEESSIDFVRYST